jgi:hypothetical protein
MFHQPSLSNLYRSIILDLYGNVNILLNLFGKAGSFLQ